MTDLRSAPPAPPRADDHIRGGGPGELVIVYGDFTCPRCALANERLVAADARVLFRHLALRAKDVRAVPAAHAVEAAALQGAFWAFHDALYADQGRLEDPHLWEYARTLGLDLARFDADRRGPEVATRVQRDVREALAAGATTTPTLFAGEVIHPGPPDDELLAALGYDVQVPIPKRR